jgi:hypothetical protein
MSCCGELTELGPAGLSPAAVLMRCVRCERVPFGLKPAPKGWVTSLADRIYKLRLEAAENAYDTRALDR